MKLMFVEFLLFFRITTIIKPVMSFNKIKNDRIVTDAHNLRLENVFVDDLLEFLIDLW